MATVLVNAGKGIVTNRIIGGGTEPKWAAIGTGVGTAAIADTTLFTEVETRVGANAGTQVTTTTTSDAYQVVNTVAITAIRAITNARQDSCSSPEHVGFEVFLWRPADLEAIVRILGSRDVSG